MTDKDLKDLCGGVVVDARGQEPAEQLAMAKNAADGIEPGVVIEMLSNDAGTKKGLADWAQEAGHEYLGFTLSIGAEVCYRIFFRKKKPQGLIKESA